MNSLNAISPIDGRYRSKVDALASYFSEGALIRYRVRVEIEYFIALGQVPQLPLQKLFAQRPELQNDLRAIYQNFTDDDALEVKEIEKTTNHDVKAVEYSIKRRFDTLGLEVYPFRPHLAGYQQHLGTVVHQRVPRGGAVAALRGYSLAH